MKTTKGNQENDTELGVTSYNQNTNNPRRVEEVERRPSEKELKYPKSVFFIISNELCERFSYYGMRTILAIYLQKKLRYDENTATVIFHLFVMLCYFFPIVGAIIADSFLGKFRTILYLSIVYAIGNIVLATSSASIIPIPHRELSILGLILIAIGTGGIKPCVSAFGGDQFVVPQQEKQLQQFFSVFYFSINIGAMLGTLISPELRQDVSCLGEDTCFPLAFALPAFFMVLALIIFVSGKSMYKIKQPQGNILVDVCKCVTYALKQKLFCAEQKKHDHWMDYAGDKYDKTLIKDIKIILSIALILSPTIFFWALFEQQGSSWTFQASRMNGALWGGFDIKPDQIHIINPILILLLIPLFQKHLYPFLAKLHLLRTPLQKMSFGGIVAASSFLISGILELQLQPTYAVLPTNGEAQLRLFNGYNCPIDLHMDHGIHNIIDSHDFLEFKSLDVSRQKNLKATMTISKNNCPDLVNDLKWSGDLSISEKEAVSYLIFGSNTNMKIESSGFDNIEKSDYGKPKLRILYSIPETTDLSLSHIHQKDSFNALLNSSTITIPDVILETGQYSLKINGSEITPDITLLFGAVYRLMIVNENGKINYNLFTVTPPNSIHMLWILPQLIVITLAEIFFSITGLEFSFMQAPNSMKSVASSLWLLTTSLGNLVVVFVVELLKSDNRAYQFFTYGGSMIVVMAIFIFLAMRYKYVQIVTDDNDLKNNGTVNKAFTPDSEDSKRN